MSMIDDMSDKKVVKTLADEAKTMMKKHKVEVIYHCGGYWFFSRLAAENHLATLNGKGKVEEFKNE